MEGSVQGRIRKPIQSRVTKPQASERTFNTPPLDCETLISTYRKSQRRLFMFDYDGTLTNIVHDPDTALSRDPVISDLNVLAADDRNEVWIVSGRPESFLEEHLGHISALGLSAEHGCFIREPYHSNWVTLTEKLDLAWQEKVLEIFGKYTASGSHGTHIERKRIALTWHFRRADSRWSASAARACLLELQEKVEPFYEVDILKGKMNLEVRPRFVNKGEIARRLVESYQPDEPPDFVLCIGDDHTDEDMFRSLKSSNLPGHSVFAVTVGASSKQTLASYYVFEPADVISAIETLNKSVYAPGAGAVNIGAGVAQGEGRGVVEGQELG